MTVFTAETVGLIVAAGYSRRLGQSKALLKISGETVLGRLCSVYQEAGVAEVIVVTQASIAAHLRWRPGSLVRLIEGVPDGEMIDSLIAGISAVRPSTEGVVFQPVDAVFTSKAMVRSLLEEGGDKRILTYDEKPGHPVFFSRNTFPSIVKRPAGGLRSVLNDAVSVPWPNDDILFDLDTPADLKALRTRVPAHPETISHRKK